MPRYFSLSISSSTGHRKSLSAAGEDEKASTDATKPTNKLRKPRRFSLITPSSKESPATPPAFKLPIHMSESSSSSSSTLSPSPPSSSPPSTPAKSIKAGLGTRNRTISLRSVRSISSFIQHHSRSSSTPSASSSEDGTTVLPPQTPSPMKAIPQKVATKVKKSIRRLGSSLHLPHVTLKSRRSDSSLHGANIVVVPPSPHDPQSTHDELEHEQTASSDPLGDSVPVPPQRTDNLDTDALPAPVEEMPQSATTEVAPVPTPTVDSAARSAAALRDIEPPLLASELAINTLVYVEPEVPDPFLIDDEGDALSEEEREEHEGTPSLAPSASPEPPAHEIALSVNTAMSPASSEPPISSPLNLNKDVPPPPPEEDDQEEAPDLYLPGLIAPTMFLPIPNTDPLTTLLTKYIYPPEKRPTRDVSGEWKRSDIHTLVMTNSWRALAKMARDRIVVSNPADIEAMLGLWYLRLASLARLRLSNQTAAECTNLFAALDAIEPTETRHWVFERILPFELEVMHARVKYWAGDHMGYLDALSGLLNKCKQKAREATASDKGEDPQEVKDMWKERGARLCLILASQLVEMRDFTAAAKLLEPLCTQSSANETEPKVITNPSLRSAVARIYLQGGNVQLAAHHFSLVAQDPSADETLKKMNEAMLGAAEGEWDRCVTVLQELIEKDAENYIAINNLSVALLSQGKLKEAIGVLEKPLKSSPSIVVVAEPFLFNLSTLYELRSAAGLEKKKDLLIEVAKWSGDGLRASCLKMPTS